MFPFKVDFVSGTEALRPSSDGNSRYFIKRYPVLPSDTEAKTNQKYHKDAEKQKETDDSHEDYEVERRKRDSQYDSPQLNKHLAPEKEAEQFQVVSEELQGVKMLPTKISKSLSQHYSKQLPQLSAEMDNQSDEFYGETASEQSLWAYTLRVVRVIPEDQGVYSCHAGPNGAAASIPVTVKGKLVLLHHHFTVNVNLSTKHSNFVLFII